MTASFVPKSPAQWSRVWNVLSIVVSTAILLTPAVLNGYPFIFSDSGTYLLSAMRLQVPYDRPVFYSIFAAMLHWGVSPWPIVIAQSALVALLIQILAKSLFDIRTPWVTPVAAAVLAIGSSLPWFSGQIMPDIFTAILILALLLIVIGWRRMFAWERVLALCLVPLCISMHNANLLITLSVIPAVGLILMLGWRPGSQVRLRMLLVAGGMALAVTALLASNYAARGRLVLSPAASTFLFAKLLEDGPAMAVLEAECPGSYALCSQLPSLQAHRAAGKSSLGDYFLWDGPLLSLGWWKPVEPEAADVVKKALALYWPQQAMKSLTNGMRQLSHFQIGDALSSDPGVAASQAIRSIFGERSFATYASSLQGQGKLDFTTLNRLHFIVIVLSMVILSLAAVRSWGRDRMALHLTAFVFAMLLAHAVVVGALTPLHDRYQSRVVWLIPLLAVLALADAIRVGKIRRDVYHLAHPEKSR